MSAFLLQDPDKTHDLLDDLESVFWVMAYGALKLFAQPGQQLLLRVFDEQLVDDRGRCIGGQGKEVSILKFARVTYTSEILQAVMRDFCKSWWKYHMARRDDPFLEDLKVQDADVMKILDLAADATYWAEKIARLVQTVDPSNQSQPCSMRKDPQRSNRAEDVPRTRCSDGPSRPVDRALASGPPYRYRLRPRAGHQISHSPTPAVSDAIVRNLGKRKREADDDCATRVRKSLRSTCCKLYIIHDHLTYVPEK